MDTGTSLIVVVAIAAVLVIAVVAGLAVLYADYRAARMNPPRPPGYIPGPARPPVQDEPTPRRGPRQDVRFGPVDSTQRSAPGGSRQASPRAKFSSEPSIRIPERRLRCPFCTRQIEQESYLTNDVIECQICHTHYHRECYEFIGNKCQMH